jgi:uncharacterized protein YcbX
MHLSRIDIFPIKALDGVSVPEARITAGGILENDRVYSIVDHDGKMVNGKRTARVHQLRCAFDAEFREARLWQDRQSPKQFCLDTRTGIDEWLSDFFGFAVRLQHDSEKGFPDDREAFGPTVTSTASLETLQGWYPEITLESIRRRFRANLELGGGEPFCEDRLYGAPGEQKPFQIGDVGFLGHNPCQRCVVPTRDPDTGEATADFQKQFMKLRKDHLPAWANPQRFNHYYRFAVNSSIPATEVGKRLRIGDALSLR